MLMFLVQFCHFKLETRILLSNPSIYIDAVIAKKVTSKRAASAASKVLRDKRTSKTSKTAAGSALSQREKRKPRKK